MADLERMTESQQQAHLAASIRLKRIEQGIDPDTGERRFDWNVAADSTSKEVQAVQ
jgi:hypothetical protein